MASAKKEQTTKATTKASSQKRAAGEPQKAPSSRNRNLLFVAAGIIILAAIALFFVSQEGPVQVSTASFSAFKASLSAAPRISLLVNYNNLTQFNSEEPCVTYLIEILSNQRSPSTIDFYEANATSCTYSPNGLGHQVIPQNASAATCTSEAGAEPGLVLNYNNYNSSTINAQQLYQNGNANYWAQCPLAVDLS